MFKGRFVNGTLEFGPYVKSKLKEFIAKNPNLPFELKPLLPESINQRKFFEGAVVPLVAYYQEGIDHRSLVDVIKVREWLKIEFNGEIIEVMGKPIKIAKSTKRVLNQGFLERVIGWIEENYNPPEQALNPEGYKYWRDAIYSMGGPETYIDYLIEMGLLK